MNETNATTFFGLMSVRAVLDAQLRTPYRLWVCDDSSVRGLARLIARALAAERQLPWIEEIRYSTGSAKRSEVDLT